MRYDSCTAPKLHARPTHDKELSSDHRSKASGGCNPGAVALPALAASLLLYTVVMLEQRDEVKRIRSASEASR